MAKIKTECSCGEQHDFDKDLLNKLQLVEPPEFIECGECPVCSPELFDTPEAHEDEAYKEEVDIEKLNDELFIEEDIIEDDLNDDDDY